MTTLAAAAAAFHSLSKTSPLPHHHLFPSCYSSFSTVSFLTSSCGRGCGSLQLRPRATENRYKSSRSRKIRSLAEETQVPEGGVAEEVEEEQKEQGEETGTSEQTVSVPVSPSDKLIMYFQAEGVVSETAIPTVTKALEGIEVISDLRVQVSEGIASVELMKQTTIQATGVASGLVEAIQGSGFKLQTLNLSFEDEEEILIA